MVPNEGQDNALSDLQGAVVKHPQRPTGRDAAVNYFPWQEKLVAPFIATPNEDTQFEDEVTKGRKERTTLQAT